MTAWAIVIMAVDFTGRATVITDPKTSMEAWEKVLNWICTTPWWFPASLALLVTASIYLPDVRRLSTKQQPRPAADDAKALPKTPEVQAGSLPPYERDVWLSDAIWRAYGGVWARPVAGQSLSASTYQEVSDLIAGPIRQRSFDGKLPIWGKRKGFDLWEEIPKEFWRIFGIDYLTFIQEPPENVKAQSDRLGSPSDWREFKTSRAAVEALWPSTYAAKSNLRLSVGEDGNYFKTTSASLYNTKRVFNLRIENAHNEKTITDIKITILAIEPQREDMGPWVLRSNISLAAGDSISVPLVSFVEGSNGEYANSTRFDRSESFFELLIDKVVRPGGPKEIPQTISIRATGIETPPCDFKCKVWVERPSGTFRIEEMHE